MIKIENEEVYGWEAAVRGMRNPMNSWALSDSSFEDYVPDYAMDTAVSFPCLKIGDNDLKLMKNLANAGTDHRKFMRMITVTCDIIAPLYWIAEHDTYKVGTVRNSCSFMHKGVSKPFTIDDFSVNNESELLIVNSIIPYLNELRDKYLETKNEKVFEAIRQVLPSGYNQRYTWQANYEVLRNMYHARKNHRLKEWRDFCAWIETLPYAKELICDVG